MMNLMSDAEDWFYVSYLDPVVFCWSEKAKVRESKRSPANSLGFYKKLKGNELS